MIYNLSINPGITVNAAGLEKMLNVFKAIITNKPVSDADMPAFNAPYSQQILGKYPTARPYVFVFKETDTTNMSSDGKTTTNPGFATLWFKKEHPLYKDHMTYVGVRFMPLGPLGSMGTYAIYIDTAELVTDKGVIINRIWGSNSGYKWYVNATPSSSYPYFAAYGPVVNRANLYYFNTWTLNISDFGLGFFCGDMSGSPLNAFFGNYVGTLMLESIATVTGDAVTSQTFVSDNYPMIGLLYSSGGPNGGAWNTRALGLIRSPDLTGQDQPNPYNAQLYKVLDCAIYTQPSAGKSTNNTETYGSDNTVMEVINANGVKASELYPEYVRNVFGGSPIAKLPVLRPLQGGANYAHYGRTITLNTTESWMGMQALQDFEINLANIASNSYLKTLKTAPARQAYLRMD